MTEKSFKIYVKSKQDEILDLFNEIASHIDIFEICRSEEEADIYVLGPDQDTKTFTSPGETKAVLKLIEQGAVYKGPIPAVCLPVKPSRLIKALLEAHPTPEVDPVLTKDITTKLFQLSPASLEFRNLKTGKKVRLTEKEYHLLYALADAEENWMSKDEILETVWGYSESASIETHTLETHIYRLRRKIEETPSKPEIFLNENQGYRLKTD